MFPRLAVLASCLLALSVAASEGGLHQAAFVGHTSRIQKGVESNPAQASTKDATGSTALHYATAQGHLATVQALLKAKSDPHAKDARGRTALHLAAGRGAAKIIEALLAAGAKVDEVDTIGHTALHHAARHAQADVVKMLLEAGANPNVLTTKWPHGGWSPLFYAAASGDPAIIDMLLAKGATPASKLRDGIKLLHIAIGSRSLPVLKKILELKETNVNAQTKRGSTALHSAAGAHWKEGCALLLEKGADPNLMNSSGEAPLHVMCHHSGSAEIATLLIANKADLNLRGGKAKRTPLHILAAWGAHRGLLPVLLDAGANPNVKDANGNTPLHTAAASNYADRIKLLLTKNADASIKNTKGATPADLSRKSRRPKASTIKMLEDAAAKK